MNLKSLKDFPVFDQSEAQIIGKVERAVLGDDFQILYVVVDIPGQGLKMVAPADFHLTPEALCIHDITGMKSYAYGEESSIYDLKTGDMVFDHQGKELGWVSDFLMSLPSKRVWGIEVTAGIIPDLLDGRREIPLDQVNWLSQTSALLDQEGR